MREEESFPAWDQCCRASLTHRLEERRREGEREGGREGKEGESGKVDYTVPNFSINIQVPVDTCNVHVHVHVYSPTSTSAGLLKRGIFQQ